MLPQFYTVDCAPRNYNQNRLLSSIVIDGDLLVYGFTVYNTKASAQFLQLFDASALPADTAVPAVVFPLGANTGTANFVQTRYPNGRHCQYGLVLCNSSTDTTKTIGSADCLFDVQYDVVDVGSEA